MEQEKEALRQQAKEAILFSAPPYLVAASSVVGKKEKEGPLGECFDLFDEEGRFGE